MATAQKSVRVMMGCCKTSSYSALRGSKPTQHQVAVQDCVDLFCTECFIRLHRKGKRGSLRRLDCSSCWLVCEGLIIMGHCPAVISKAFESNNLSKKHPCRLAVPRSSRHGTSKSGPRPNHATCALPFNRLRRPMALSRGLGLLTVTPLEDWCLPLSSALRRDCPFVACRNLEPRAFQNH